MRGSLGALALAGFIAVAIAHPAIAAKRVALVIGNDVYPKLPADAQLKKAVNDAQAMAGKLGELGYTVIAGENADFRQFYALWEEFSAAVAPGDEVAIFFSGHGVEIKGQNYLVPVDAVPPKSGEQTAFRKQLIDLGELAEVLKDERQPRVALFIVDACRNNPFRAADGTKAIGGAKGLAMVEPPKGTFMMFSAGSGELALDRLSDTDPDPNSIYTRNLLPLLGQKGLTIQDVAQKVRAEVSALARAARNHDQNPGYRDELLGERGPLCLAGCEEGSGEGATPVDPAQPSSSDLAAAAWAEAKDSGNRAMLEAIVKRFPDSVYADFAAAKLKDLDQKIAVLTPRTAPAEASSCEALLVKVGTKDECLKPGDVFRDCSDCPEMVVLPAGAFTMGSSEEEIANLVKEDAVEEGWWKIQGPQHELTIAKPFAIGKFEVTRGEFAAFVAATDHETGVCLVFDGTNWKVTPGKSWRGPGYAQTDDHPVACVSWDDAKAYVAWLAKETGRDYRLLSEAEWEYAARGETKPGSHPHFHFGNDEKRLCDYAKGADKSTSFDGTNKTCSDGVGNSAAPVGRYQANAFGLYDMHGNLWEWTEECYHDSYWGAPNDGSTWGTACPDHSSRVIRGGSWRHGPRKLRSAFRNANSPGNQSSDIGFRLARTLTP